MHGCGGGGAPPPPLSRAIPGLRECVHPPPKRVHPLSPFLLFPFSGTTPSAPWGRAPAQRPVVGLGGSPRIACQPCIAAVQDPARRAAGQEIAIDFTHAPPGKPLAEAPGGRLCQTGGTFPEAPLPLAISVSVKCAFCMYTHLLRCVVHTGFACVALMAWPPILPWLYPQAQVRNNRRLVYFCRFRGHLVHRNPPLFVVLTPQNCPSKRTPRPLYQCPLGCGMLEAPAQIRWVPK